MASVERVTVNLIRDIDRHEKNRSKFVAEAVSHELDRRRRAELLRPLRNPHPESRTRRTGLEEWARGLTREATDALVDSGAGKPVRWVAGEGWVEERE
jgi:hypothetical protein